MGRTTTPLAPASRLRHVRHFVAMVGSLLLTCFAWQVDAQVLLSESFDGTTFPPTGWTSTTGGTSFTLAAWSRVTSGSSPSTSPHSGAGMAMFNSFNAQNGNAELRTPVLSFTNPGYVTVSFWMYRDGGYSSTADSVSVFVNTSATVTGATQIGRVNRAIGLAPAVQADGWYNYTFTVPSGFTTSTNYIIFQGTSYYGNNIFVDDITVTNYPPCSGTPAAGTAVATPRNPCFNATSVVTLTGATVAANLTYQWQQWNAATSTWVSAVGGTGATTSTYTTPSVTSQTIYRAAITCNNTGGGTSYSQPDTVSVNAPSLPYLETFESITANNQLPNCMIATGTMNSQQYTYTTNQTSPRINHTTTPATASKYGTFYGNYSGTNWFITPALNLTAGTTYRFSYWYIASTSTAYNSLKGAVGTSQSAGAMTTILNTITTPSNTTYQQAVTTFTPLTSGTYYFGVGAEANYNYAYLTVDDISIDALPFCSGTPVVTTSPSDSLLICPTANFTLSGSAGAYSGLTYQWDSSLNGTTWFSIPNNATSPTYSSSASGGNVYYRLRVTCSGTATGVSSTVLVKITGPQPTTLPYFTSFENWSNYCGNSDVPSGGNWAQANVLNGSGNNAWRRNDQGSTAGWTNPTLGSYSPTSKHGSYSARYHTYSTGSYMPQNGYDEGQLDLYLNMSGVTGSAGLYFFMNNGYSSYANDSLVILYSNNGGLSFQQLAGYDTATGWQKRIVNIPGGAAISVIRFAARKWGPYDYTDIGIDSVYVAPPCTGTPVAGTLSPAGPISGCAGSQYTFNLTGTSMAGNINITWQSSTNGTTWTTIPGATGYQYTSGPVTSTTYFRAVATCGGTSTSANSNAVQVTISSSVTPATLPYTEDFENWASRCSTTDIPTASWTNIPSTGNQSWRREDQGASASWSSPTIGVYNPASSTGSHSARFHNYYASPYNSYGTMDLYVDASAAGAKELQYTARVGSPSYAYDSLSVSYSSNGGQTWQWLNTINQTTGWQSYTHSLTNATTATTVIRFRAYSYNYVEDIGLDNVRVLPACTGTPTAGTIIPVTPCANTNFDLKLSGTSAQGGLTYQWRYINAPTAFNVAPGKNNANWTTPMTGGNTATWTSQISQNRYVQVIVTCPNSNQRDTSATYYVQLAPFSQCYCSSAPYYPTVYSGNGGNIGNVTLRTQPANTVILNNGNASPATGNTTAVNGYTSFYSLTPTPMYKDSVYRATVAKITYSTFNYTSPVSIFIDYNQDGNFDPTTERVVSTLATGVTVPSYTATANFTIPATAKTGVTGMRVILVDNYGTTTQPNPCGLYYNYGETEDYLVEIRDHPCGGPANAGTALVSDTSICTGYTVTLTDTTYEKQQYGLVRQWQQSTNGGQSWQNVGATNRDTLKPTVAASTLYRLRVTCSVTGDSSFSNVVTVSLNPPYACYCVSYATGGQFRDNDKSDIGSFIISKPVSSGSPQPIYSFKAGDTAAGPHLLNPLATRVRTDYTKVAQPTQSGYMELWADSSYVLEAFHIQSDSPSRSAKITLFMDFNNNLQYEAAPGNGYPAERVWSTATAPTDWYKTTQITIPSQQIITDVPTGMRLILNENTAANIPSDEACGVYNAGETEDYVVVFRKVGGVQGVGSIASLKSLGLYPNPTNGKTTLMFTADRAIKELDVTVTNMTGQVMLQQSYTAPGKQFSTELDLTDRPRGVYFIELRADGEKAVRKLVVR